MQSSKNNAGFELNIDPASAQKLNALLENKAFMQMNMAGHRADEEGEPGYDQTLGFAPKHHPLTIE
ncbi:hypothetical protein [Chitinophaga silvisoli]|uniref:Uncharacterized protein n=1 Tax=Chitinophaga silvisoli TaxID=2291814 RepID=A0A3E1P010_9BACT|nr:hypothetical protein [Chitinophaga silvisoli]RFM33480.1 hypothetical protein DXN04_16090 [Chitinophaga silvisoli]